MRHGSNLRHPRSPLRPRYNLRPLLTAELLFGIGLSLLALVVAWPTRSSSSSTFVEPQDHPAGRWGQMQATAVGATGLLNMRLPSFEQPTAVTRQDDASETTGESEDQPQAPRLLRPGVALSRRIDQPSRIPTVEVPATYKSEVVPVPKQLVEGPSAVVHAAPQRIHQEPIAVCGWFELAIPTTPVQQAVAVASVSDDEQDDEQVASEPTNQGFPASLKLEPLPQEFYDEQAIAEIASIRARLGGSVVDSVDEQDASSLPAVEESLAADSTEAEDDRRMDFLQQLRGVLERRDGAMPWRPQQSAPAGEPESATVMMPSIDFESNLHQSTAGPVEAAVHHGRAPVVVTSYQEQANAPSSPNDSSPTSPQGDGEMSQRLRDWSRELDNVAADSEDEQDYSRADLLRELAQQIRVKARELDGVSAPTIPSPPVIYQGIVSPYVSPYRVERIYPPGIPSTEPVSGANRPARREGDGADEFEYPRDPETRSRMIRRVERLREIDALPDRESTRE